MRASPDQTTALTPLATVGDFVLYERRDRSTAEWTNLKLVHSGDNHRKKYWWLGWNGERLARSTDAARLPRRYM
jgi:hypothetical protein